MPGREGLHWHAQITSVKLRGYVGSSDDYEKRIPYDAVADVYLLGGGMAFAHGALTRGHRLNKTDMARIGELMQALGVTSLMAERSGKLVQWWSAQAPSAPMDLGPPIR